MWCRKWNQLNISDNKTDHKEKRIHAFSWDINIQCSHKFFSPCALCSCQIFYQKYFCLWYAMMIYKETTNWVSTWHSTLHNYLTGLGTCSKELFLSLSTLTVTTDSITGLIIKQISHNFQVISFHIYACIMEKVEWVTFTLYLKENKWIGTRYQKVFKKVLMAARIKVPLCC